MPLRDPYLILQLAVAAFFAILFLQSGIDKVADRQGNLDFYNKHFANSPLKNFTRVSLTILSILEISCGVLFAIGFLVVLFTGSSRFCVYANIIALVNFVCLFFGQRISKDYAGAAAIVPYFILAIIGIFVF